MHKIYMAGPLFSEADQRQRVLEVNKLRTELTNGGLTEGLDFEVFAPIEADVNDKSTLPSAEDIYKADRDALMSSTVVLADLAYYDAGVMLELGMVIEEGVHVLAWDSDLRLSTAGEYNGIRVPYGTNQFVIGALLHEGHGVYGNFSEALEELKELFI